MPLPRTPRSKIAALVAAAALVSAGSGAGDAAAAQAQERERRERRKGPEELWSLYPLNPLAGRQQRSPSPAPSAAVGEKPSDAVASKPITVEHAADRDESGVPWLLLVAGGAALVAAGWGLAHRRRPAPAGGPAPIETGASGPRPQPAVEPAVPAGSAARPARAAVATSDRSPEPAASRREAPAAAPSRAPAVAAVTPRATPAAADPRVAQHVCVHLHDGRRIEGWKKDSRARDQRVLILDVENVYDPDGNRVGATALDRFLLPPQIERIELLD